ncbi:hypothetical protein ScPMuIL_000827 [Solemya velum]
MNRLWNKWRKGKKSTAEDSGTPNKEEHDSSQSVPAAEGIEWPEEEKPHSSRESVMSENGGDTYENKFSDDSGSSEEKGKAPISQTEESLTSQAELVFSKLSFRQSSNTASCNEKEKQTISDSMATGLSDSENLIKGDKNSLIRTSEATRPVPCQRLNTKHSAVEDSLEDQSQLEKSICISVPPKQEKISVYKPIPDDKHSNEPEDKHYNEPDDKHSNEPDDGKDGFPEPRVSVKDRIQMLEKNQIPVYKFKGSPMRGNPVTTESSSLHGTQKLDVSCMEVEDASFEEPVSPPWSMLDDSLLSSVHSQQLFGSGVVISKVPSADVIDTNKSDLDSEPSEPNEKKTDSHGLVNQKSTITCLLESEQNVQSYVECTGVASNEEIEEQVCTENRDSLSQEAHSDSDDEGREQTSTPKIQEERDLIEHGIGKEFEKSFGPEHEEQMDASILADSDQTPVTSIQMPQSVIDANKFDLDSEPNEPNEEKTDSQALVNQKSTISSLPEGEQNVPSYVECTGVSLNEEIEEQVCTENKDSLSQEARSDSCVEGREQTSTPKIQEKSHITEHGTRNEFEKSFGPEHEDQMEATISADSGQTLGTSMQMSQCVPSRTTENVAQPRKLHFPSYPNIPQLPNIQQSVQNRMAENVAHPSMPNYPRYPSIPQLPNIQQPPYRNQPPYGYGVPQLSPEQLQQMFRARAYYPPPPYAAGNPHQYQQNLQFNLQGQPQRAPHNMGQQQCPPHMAYRQSPWSLGQHPQQRQYSPPNYTPPQVSGPYPGQGLASEDLGPSANTNVPSKDTDPVDKKPVTSHDTRPSAKKPTATRGTGFSAEKPVRGKKIGTQPDPMKGRQKAEEEEVKRRKTEESAIKVLVKGIAESCTLDGVKNFIEAKSKGTVEEMVPGPEMGIMLVTLGDNPDFKRLQTACRSFKLEGKTLQVFEVSQPTGIIVSSEKPVESLDGLKYYFENSMRSGGGDLAELEPEQTDCGSVIFYFQDPTVVPIVCDKKRSHIVDKIRLTVSPVYGSGNNRTWDSSLHSVPIPKSISLDSLDTDKLQFLKSSKQAHSNLSDFLKQFHAELTIDGSEAKLKCLLEPSTSNVRVLVKRWKDDAVEKINEYLSHKIKVQKISIIPEAWEIFLKKISSISVSDPQRVIVRLDGKTCVIIGFVEDSMVLMQQMNKIKNETEDQVNRKNRLTSEYLSEQKFPVISLLENQKIFARISQNFKDLKIEPDAVAGKVKFSGIPEDIQSAKVDVWKEINKLQDSMLETLSCYQLKVLDRPTVRTYIKDKINKQGLFGEWQVVKKGIITVVMPEVDMEKFEDSLETSVMEEELVLEEESVLCLKTPQWKSKMQDLNPNEKILIEQDSTGLSKTFLFVVTTDDIHQDVVRDIRQFIEDNTELKRPFPLDPIKVRFLTKHYMEMLNSLRRSHDVEISISANQTVLLVGFAKNLKKAQSKLKEINSTIIHMPHTVTKPGINKLIRSEKGRSIITTVEDTCKCVIDVPGCGDDVGMGAVAMDMQFSSMQENIEESGDFQATMAVKKGPYVAKHGSKISLIKGEIGKQKADIVVCATSPDLNLKNGAASKSVLQEAGDGIQAECQQQYPDGLKHGHVAVVGSHNMHCDHVYLGFLPTWREEIDTSLNQKTICKFMKSCMVQATQAGAKSISFPAMGTGQLGYPKEDTAHLMFNSIVEFDAQFPTSTVKNINFVIYHKDLATFAAFDKEERAYLNPGLRRFVSTVRAPVQTRQCGIKISIVLGDIAKEKVDIIACVSSSRLDLASGGATGALLKAGGPSIQTECTKKLTKEGLQVGKCVVVAPGKLHCKKLCFSVLPKYSDGKAAAEKALENFMVQCLEIAEQAKYQTIAFPVIGTGYLKFPGQRVANIMFNAVDVFDSKRPQTCVKAVHFVVYPRDQAKEAFQNEERMMRGEGFEARKQRKLVDHSGASTQGATQEGKPNEFRVGQANLTVKHGDITEQVVDVIVRSANIGLGFDQGAVSQIIKRKSRFKELQDECKQKQYKMGQKGVVITASHGLRAKHILHIQFQDTLGDWKKIMLKCLKKAEKKSFSSVAFPVLGSGKGPTSFQEEKIGCKLYEAVREFAASGSNIHLKDIRLIVYDVPSAQNIVVSIGNLVHKGTPSFSTKIRKKVPTDKVSEVTFEIYSDSQVEISKAQEMLDLRIKSEFKTRVVEDSFIQDLSSDEIREIESLRMHDIEIEIDISANQIPFWDN